MLFEGALNGQIVGVVLGVWVVAILSLKYGESGLSSLDKLCLAGAVVGIVLWQMFDSPTLAIVTSLTVAFLGSIPTFASAWEDPSRENKLTWTIFEISSVFAVLAIPRWTLADAAQPILFLIVDSIIIYILYVHARSLVAAPATTRSTAT